MENAPGMRGEFVIRAQEGEEIVSLESGPDETTEVIKGFLGSGG
jgi:hypothetical protein